MSVEYLSTFPHNFDPVKYTIKTREDYGIVPIPGDYEYVNPESQPLRSADIKPDPEPTGNTKVPPSPCMDPRKEPPIEYQNVDPTQEPPIEYLNVDPKQEPPVPHRALTRSMTKRALRTPTENKEPPVNQKPTEYKEPPENPKPTEFKEPPVNPKPKEYAVSGVNSAMRRDTSSGQSRVHYRLNFVNWPSDWPDWYLPEEIPKCEWSIRKFHESTPNAPMDDFVKNLLSD